MPPAAFFLAGATVAEPSTLLGTGLRALVGFALKKAISQAETRRSHNDSPAAMRGDRLDERTITLAADIPLP